MRLTRYVPALLTLALPFVACGADDKPIQPLGQSSAITAETAPTNPPSTSVVTVEPTPQPTVEITTTTEAPPTTEAVPVTRPVRTVPTVVEVPRTTVQRASGPTPPEYIKQCESGGDYTAVNPNGHYGAWQFSMSTWRSVGGTGRPDQASPAEQDYRASILWDNGRGASHWECA